MQKPRLIVFMAGLALTMALTACQQVTPVPATVEATQPSQTETSASVTAPAVALPKEAGPVLPCKPYSLPFTAVTEKDWSAGPQDASVTILEYSDFQ